MLPKFSLVYRRNDTRRLRVSLEIDRTVMSTFSVVIVISPHPYLGNASDSRRRKRAFDLDVQFARGDIGRQYDTVDEATQRFFCRRHVIGFAQLSDQNANLL